MRVGHTETVNCPVSYGLAKEYLQDIDNLGLYEPKIDRLVVLEKEKKSGRYLSEGRFCKIPYSLEFSFELTPHGFHSDLISKHWSGLQVNGGFVVREESSKRCSISHYENYDFSMGMLFLKFPIKLYLKQSIKTELQNIKKALFELHSCSIHASADTGNQMSPS